MAITRCPYCHAIIDENDKYCNNCGTQLLFSEDEEIEEDIPGEKIIDADVEEKDYTVDEPEGEKRPDAEKDLAEDVDEKVDEESLEGTEEKALDDLIAEEAEEERDGAVTEEVILVDEIEAAELKKADEKDEEEIVEIPEPLSSSDEDADVEYITETSESDIASTAGESAFRPVTFDTRELEGIGKTVEIGKEKIDKFMEGLAEKQAEPPASQERADRTPTPEPATAERAAGEPPTGSLPPWASTMKGAPAFPDDTGPVETRKIVGGEPMPAPTTGEVEIFPRRRGSDSTIGLPERVSQAPLPFEREATGEAVAEGEVEDETREEAIPPAKPVREQEELRGPALRETVAAGAIEEAEPGPPFSFSVFFKSKAFDVLFVGVFWLVAIWLAAHSMDRTLFEILGGMSGSMVLLYVVLLILYVFLFKFFLGETLGDRLFRERE